MELIYAWIEKFRNIEQCGFDLSDEFCVLVNHDSIEEIKNSNISIKTISIEKKRVLPNIYGENICSVTAVVGKNSTGKTNVLTCIGDLITSFHYSSFILVYFDREKNKYILECNRIGIRNEGKTIYAMHQEFQPRTKIYEYVNGEILLYENIQNLKSRIEFITVRNILDTMVRPNANDFYSSIGRFGLSYAECGLYYMFAYLNDYDNEENLKNNNVSIEFEIIRGKDDCSLMILPRKFPGKQCGFDFNDIDGNEVYKKVFMLRFFEQVLNKMHFFDNEIVKLEREELKNIVENCDGNIDRLLEKYGEIKCRVIDIRLKLMENRRGNKIDIDNCYKQFVNSLESMISKIDEQNFQSSSKCSVNISADLVCEEFMGCVRKLLEFSDEADICLEFIPGILKINMNGLSDGLKYLLNLYSTIQKCLKQNEASAVKNIILILDEPEIHMHPDWSRKLLNKMFGFLKDKFPENKFQIILSTHSPFILSDIPKNDIVFLEKDEKGFALVKNTDLNTFGANIHTMLKDSFFMKSTIGEFARIQINEVLKFLTYKEYEGGMDKDKVEYIIDKIDDGLIRNKLESLYEEKYQEEEKTILEYKNKIKELENSLKLYKSRGSDTLENGGGKDD